VAEDLTQALDFDDVADPGRGAVAFDHRRAVGGDAGIAPGAFDGEPLADGVGRRDAFAAAVTRTGEAADHSVNPVAVALGVGQPLEHEHRRPLAHHEAVGAVGVGAGAGGRERADLAELGVGRGAHVGVDAAGDHGIEVVFLEPLDGGVERRHRRGTGGVADEVGTVEVEQVGDPAGDDVGQLAGHGVLGDLGQPPAETRLHLLEHATTDVVRQGREAGCVGQLVGDLGEADPQHGAVVLLAGHGVAQDHRGALGVEGPLGVAVVQQRLARRRQGPFLGPVHGGVDLGR
jgi:hypothetical protein